MRKPSLLLGLMLLCVTLLTACGFKLRGSYDLPFETLYIALPESHELHAALKRNIEAGTKTRIVDNREDAQATLTVVYDRTLQTILSLSGTGRVTEYQLVRTFAFRVIGKDNRDIIPQREIVLRRDLPYSDNVVLAKASETELLIRDMQSDLVNQILRRLAAAKVKNISAEPAAAEAQSGNAVTR
ncbi:MAG TPA: LPS assembly lipoprotein LptE [Rhodocyclaceae bacterium]|nr:LPS assembly lipoprotein LptE [Rhodocyclaceae bacterium]